MSRVAIVGGGPLGGVPLASALAISEICAHVQLLDDLGGRATAGKALDIRQSCPIAGADTQVTAVGLSESIAGVNLVAVADRADTGTEWQGEEGLAILARVLAANPRAPVVFAGASQAWLMERSVAELFRSARSIIGSAPLALEAAVRSLTALEADCPTSDVRLALAGRLPREVVILWDAATVASEPALNRLSPRAASRVERRTAALWPPGPYALASAAAYVIRTLLEDARRTVTCFTVDERLAQAVVLPVRLGADGVQSAVRPTSPRALAALAP